MMKFDTLKEAAHFRVVENEDNYWIEDYWKVTIELFTKDVATTIKFLKTIVTMRNCISFLKFSRKLLNKHKAKKSSQCFVLDFLK